MTLSDYIIDDDQVTEGHRAWLTIIHLALVIESDSAPDVEEFLSRCPSLLAWSPGGNNPLRCGTWETWGPGCGPVCYAVAVGSTEVLRVLLRDRQAAREASKSTAARVFRLDQAFESCSWLHDACRFGYPDVVRLLLDLSPDMKAELSERDWTGATPLLAAAGFEMSHLADEGPRDRPGRRGDREQVVRMLLDMGADPLDTVQIHTGAGAEVPEEWEPRSLDNVDENNADELRLSHTLLTLAVCWAGPPLIKDLHDRGLDIHASTCHKVNFHHDRALSGITPLHVACRLRNVEAVRTLLELAGNTRDAMLASRDGLGRLPIHWVVLEYYQHGGSTLLEGETTDTRRQRMADCIELLLADDPDPQATVNALDDERRSVLHLAACLEDPSVLPVLFRHNPDAAILDVHGHTVLQTLLRHPQTVKNVAMVDLFLGHGAGVEDTGPDGNSLLHLACRRWETVGVVRHLLALGADSGRANAKGELPLHAAAACVQAYLTKSPLFDVYRRAAMAQDAIITALRAAGDRADDMDRADLSGRTPREILERNREAVRAGRVDMEQRTALNGLDRVEAAQYNAGLSLLPREWQRLARMQASSVGLEEWFHKRHVSIGAGFAYSLRRESLRYRMPRRGGGSTFYSGPRRRGLSLEMGGSVYI